MTTNRMGLEQTLSDERLAELAAEDDLYNYPPMQEELNGMARELLEYRKAGNEPVAYIFRHPSGKLFWALTDESNKEQDYVFPVYAAPPLQAVTVPDEWTDAQCLEFLTVAFRHNRIKGDIEFNDIRLGVKMANDYRPPKSVTNEP